MITLSHRRNAFKSWTIVYLWNSCEVGFDDATFPSQNQDYSDITIRKIDKQIAKLRGVQA